MTVIVLTAMWIGGALMVTGMILTYCRWYFTEGPGKNE